MHQLIVQLKEENYVIQGSIVNKAHCQWLHDKKGLTSLEKVVGNDKFVQRECIVLLLVWLLL